MRIFAPLTLWRLGDWRAEWMFLSNLTELTMNQDYRRVFKVAPALILDRPIAAAILLDRSRITKILRKAPGQHPLHATDLPPG
jgi:hypothetical protein